TGVGAQPPLEGGNLNGGFGLMTTLSPTAFQVNNLGEELQILLTCSGEVVQAVLALRICHLDGTVLYNGIKHPVFGRQNIATTVRTEIGRPAFLGTLNKALNTGYKDSNNEDRIWLAFLRVSAR
ncbi:MAG: hypothetical protein JWO89_3353, partial [Verrucomicrobiaceae bacterium]|nr:hypothetical protein [Verrucomicrobiaceae bacterium]